MDEIEKYKDYYCFNKQIYQNFNFVHLIYVIRIFYFYFYFFFLFLFFIFIIISGKIKLFYIKLTRIKVVLRDKLKMLKLSWDII